MASLYSEGKTLNEIGEKYGITRERVRQLLKQIGVSRTDGGSAVRAKKRQEELDLLKDQEYLKKYGCTLSEYNSSLRGEVSQRYNEQLCNARKRGIEWKLTKWEWFNIWKESGKFDDRGRGHDHYVMSRFGDKGAYEVGNVEIKLADDNNREYMERRLGWEKILE